MKRRILVTGGSGFIGTNFIDSLEGGEFEIVNFDSGEPFKDAHRRYWRRGDILDREAMGLVFAEFKPEWVVHFAARVECDETVTVEHGYRVNLVGTRNLMDVIGETGGVERVIITSSQFVCGPGRLPDGDEDFFPHTVYGESKVRTEKITREAGLECCWTIVRPTNVWGPCHLRYSREFWKVLNKGWYWHPDLPSPTRSYGYVGNVAWQIMRLLEADEQAVCGKVFYVGDRPVDIVEWIEGFHRAITGRRKLRRIPPVLVKAAAMAGDLVSRISGKPFYITSSRLRSMTEDYLTPMEGTFELLGEPPCSMEEGIKATVAWYRDFLAGGGR